MTDKEKLEELSNYLKKRREFYGVPFKVMAKVARMSVHTYRGYEHGVISSWTESAEKIVNSQIYDDKVMRRARDEYLKEWQERVKKRGPKVKSNDKQRIPNIPDFYERLDSISDGLGRIIVDKNHPVLQELRVDIGGERIMTEKVSLVGSE